MPTCNQGFLVRQADVLASLDGSHSGQQASAPHNAGHHRLCVLVPGHLHSTLVANQDLGLVLHILDHFLELLHTIFVGKANTVNQLGSQSGSRPAR